jgi:hypothetical protein
MICHDMTGFHGLSPQLLLKGSLFTERHLAGDKELAHWYMKGKDDSITHMLCSGNGFPTKTVHNFPTFTHQVVWDQACVQERRDIRSMNVWARDLTQALADRRNGRVDG